MHIKYTLQLVLGVHSLIVSSFLFHSKVETRFDTQYLSTICSQVHFSNNNEKKVSFSFLLSLHILHTRSYGFSPIYRPVST